MIQLAMLSFFWVNMGFAQKAVLIEDQRSQVRTQIANPTPESAGDEFETAVDLRKKRRVAVGAAAAGKLGLLGAVVELNYSPTHAAIVGFGGGPRYNSLLLEYKHHFGGRNLSPYFTFGYARWSSNSKSEQPVGNTMPGFLGTRFLSESERQTGIFAHDFFCPTLGVQYTQLQGKGVGSAVFAEIVMMLGAKNFEQAPTGSLGYLFYF